MKREINAYATHVSRKINKTEKYWNFTEIILLDTFLKEKITLYTRVKLNERLNAGRLKFAY